MGMDESEDAMGGQEEGGFWGGMGGQGGAGQGLPQHQQLSPQNYAMAMQQQQQQQHLQQQQQLQLQHQQLSPQNYAMAIQQQQHLQQQQQLQLQHQQLSPQHCALTMQQQQQQQLQEQEQRQRHNLSALTIPLSQPSLSNVSGGEPFSPTHISTPPQDQMYARQITAPTQQGGTNQSSPLIVIDGANVAEVYALMASATSGSTGRNFDGAPDSQGIR